MNSQSLFVAAALVLGAWTTPAAPKPTRVPPPGIAIAERDRDELRAVADALLREVTELRANPSLPTDRKALWPDVAIFAKAVDWGLRYDEFYRSNEVALAKSLLRAGNERARQLRAGEAPWLHATGLVVRGFVSKIDGSVQPYGVVVPAGYRSGNSAPPRLDLWLHGRDNHLTELKFLGDRLKSIGDFAPTNAIVVHPYGRYCNAFKFAGETDVFEALDHAKNSYEVNGLVALRGFSMGGAGVWHLAAHFPHKWAVATPGAGFAETPDYQNLGTNRARFPAWEQTLWQLYDTTDYAANFALLPVVAYSGTDDKQRQAGDVMERAMAAAGLKLPRVWGTNIGHKYTPESKREIEAFVNEAVSRAASRKEPFPNRVLFTTRTLRYSEAPGVQLLGLGEHWRRADIVVDRATRSVRTTNVTAFLVETPADDFTVDGQRVKAAAPRPTRTLPRTVVFEKQADGKWSAARSERHALAGKSPGLQGPIDDAFLESFLVVRPTGIAWHEATGTAAEKRLAHATNEWRGQFRGDPRVKDDSAVDETDIAAHHLVLFGDPQSNRLLARFADKLPIRWTKEHVTVGIKKFPAGTHLPVLIFPNPLNPQRYVVLNSGFTFAAAGTGSNAQQTPKLPDYAVLDVESSAVVLADFFDEQWRVK